MHRFYVYVHSRLDTGAPFYVGKGTGNRAWSITHSGRSRYWKNIVARHGRHVRIAAADLDEELAYFAESEMIEKLLRLGFRLVNSRDADGGRLSGAPVSAEHRRKLSEKRRELLSDPVRSIPSRAALLQGHQAAKRPVVCKETGREFESVSAAASWVKSFLNPNAHPSPITGVCKGSRLTAYGYTWEYKKGKSDVST